MGIDDTGDGVVVDVRVLARQELSHEDTLLLRLVSKHGARHAVADGEDVGDLWFRV